MYWNPSTRKMQEVSGRNPYDVMAYTEDGRAASDATNIEVTGMTQSGDDVLISCVGTPINGFEPGHGCLIVLENGMILFPIVTSINGNQMEMVCHNVTNPYSNVEDPTELLSMACVYPTLRVPVIYKPFFGEISALTWNLTGITVERVDNEGTVVKRVTLPTSYKVEGCIHNGLTYGNKFYSADTITVDEETGEEYVNYYTYLVFEDKSDFYESLQSPTTFDYLFDRLFYFGEGSTANGFTREVRENDPETEDFTSLAYAVVENYPEINSADTNFKEIFSGRYSGGFDLMTLEDECNLENVFHENLRIFAFSEEGRHGQCCLVANKIPNTASTELFVIPVDKNILGNDRNALFDDEGVLTTKDRTVPGIPIGKYCYGFYNKNAKYDTKGSTIQVYSPIFNTYTFGKTQANGSKIKKTVIGENSLENQGVTLLHGFSLKEDYVKYISGVTNLLDTVGQNATAATISNGAPNGNFTVFNVIDGDDNNGYGSIVEKYTRPESSSRNKMVVYKVYPVNALEVIYPSETTGLNPFISPQESIVCDYRAQTISITVASNVSFKLSSDETWATVNTTTTYGPETTSITVQVASNQGSNTSDRTATITFTSDEEGVSPAVTGQCIVRQLKDDVTPVEDKADRAQSTASGAAAEAARANRRIDNLPQN